jgi:hypothetical protein
LLFEKRARATNLGRIGLTIIGVIGAHDRTYSGMAAVKIRNARNLPAQPSEQHGAENEKARRGRALLSHMF